VGKWGHDGSAAARSASTGTAYAINPFGVVVGEKNGQAFRYTGGVMRNLSWGTTGFSVATGIRNGRIVGTLTTPTANEDLSWSAGKSRCYLSCIRKTTKQRTMRQW
jgi:hypothetical protein